MENTIKLISGFKPKMVAHRGVSWLETENTGSAFVAAGNRSYFGIETDVHRTLDGKYVCIHDSNTLRVSGKALIVEESTLEQLRSLRLFSDHSSSRFDVCIPTLQEYIMICKKYGKHPVLELKTPFTEEQLKEIVEIIQFEGLFEETIVIDFHLDNLILFRKLYPLHPAQFLIGKDYPANLVDTLVRYNLDLDIDYHGLTKELADAVHSAGHLVNVWTVNALEKAEEMIRCRVDYITTNILE